MCGIVGQISFKGQRAQKLSLQKIHHRGPDGQGTWTNEKGNVFLGHTRLAILEPTPAGHQPMTDISGLCAITFNGEIYNHHNLRDLLPKNEWRGNSDTETLVELLSRKGIHALRLLRGMFAFALYDRREKSVLLVRDRLGIKPLYVRKTDRFVSFSSELRSLFVQGETIILNDKALSQYIAFGHLPDNEEITAEVFSLKPGSWYKIYENGNVKNGNWWPETKFSRIRENTSENYGTRIKNLVSKAIEGHLISDVGIGSFLSGGIDSSIVSIIAGRKLGRHLKTFTLGFDHMNYDESKIARKVAAEIGSDHTELIISEVDCLSWVQEAVSSMDLPSIDAINTYIISKAVRRTGLKVALSGLGGDELFGGYPSFSNTPLLSTLDKIPRPVQKRIVSTLPKKYRDKLQGVSEFSTLQIAIAIRRFTSVKDLQEMGLEDGNPLIPEIPGHLDTMGKISWAEIFGYTIPMLLKDSDQMSMAVGLEIRVPFLDHELVEEVLKIPQTIKKGKDIKPLLVKAFRNELPKEVFDRPKQGFVLPMAEWMKGPLKKFTKTGIDAATAYFSIPHPQMQLERFHKGTIHWTRVWHWCVLGHWVLKQDKEAFRSWGNIFNREEILA